MTTTTTTTLACVLDCFTAGCAEAANRVRKALAPDGGPEIEDDALMECLDSTVTVTAIASDSIASVEFQKQQIFDLLDDGGALYDDDDDDQARDDADEIGSEYSDQIRHRPFTPTPHPSEPSESASLRMITVLFDPFGDRGKVLGFQFVYTDEVEITACDTPLLDTFQRTIKLAPGEHVVAVELFEPDHSEDLEGIRFKTTRGRWLDAERLDYPLPILRMTRQPKLISFPQGEVLRSIRWSPTDLKIQGFQTVPQTNFDVFEKEQQEQRGQFLPPSYICCQTPDSELREDAAKLERDGPMEEANPPQEENIQGLRNRDCGELDANPKVDTISHLRLLKRRTEAKLRGLTSAMVTKASMH